MDSFVLESDVHYPTDLNLLFDAMRKVWTLAARACQRRKIKDLRQHAYQIQRLKNQMRGIQTQKHSHSKDPEVIAKKQVALMESHREYILLAGEHLVKIDEVMTQRKINKTEEFAMFYKDALHQIDLIDRRVLKGEVIPHSEKIFSLFQRYTEWVSKGKAGVPVELGLKVCIVEDQFQFILSHRVMQQETDCEIAAPLIKKTKGVYPDLKQVSGDKGFHSPANQKELDEILDVVVIPKKGKCSKARQEVESSQAFKKVRHQHSAVESAINALEVHGLDVCPDKGLDALKRYVSLAIVARNLQRMGAILQETERRAERRKAQRNLNKALQMKAA